MCSHPVKALSQKDKRHPTQNRVPIFLQLCFHWTATIHEVYQSHINDYLKQLIGFHVSNDSRFYIVSIRSFLEYIFFDLTIP